jgi:glycerol-3-phosphate dehydrogenase (NAD(P)+)
MTASPTIFVIGAGAWGTALANAMSAPGREVTLLARDAATAARIETTRINPRLPGIRIDARMSVTSDLAEAAGATAILLVTPAQQIRVAATALAPYLAPATPVVVCAKGIEHGSRKFMSEIVAEVLPGACPAMLSGPSFADDVARGLPTAVTVACSDAAQAAALAHLLGSATFRPYHTTDVRGVEIGGAAKNVLAIAAGIVVGRKLGASALAALTTRGFAELVRFGQANGARSETLAGLSGLGDLLLSCANPQSRNFSFGIALGEGRSIDEATGDKLTEGAFTAPVLLEMARAQHIEMPIAAAVADILSGTLAIDAAIGGLLARPFKAET